MYSLKVRILRFALGRISSSSVSVKEKGGRFLDQSGEKSGD
ncbi:hypothetical protein LEP1GSC061_1896 [Leptospira wolffii serovar Khorat str. Khorat-H2]|nr:hypothetical protein LEP1GSC061_1896 [Leptospira wolffii serovar Khorat str. Khorat-H2]